MRTKVILIVAVGILIGFLFPAQVHAQAWCDSDWSNRKQITISNTNVDSDLTDFPLLVSITDTDVSANANSDALDIFFTEEATCTKLKWEKESYTSGTGVLVAWVKVPTVDADANTIIYMYYGNSGASDQTDAENVWDSNFEGVWHLSDTPTGSAGDILDSTSNNSDGDSVSMGAANATTTPINGGLDFDGANDRVGVPSFNHGITTGAFTASAWVILDVLPSAGYDGVLGMNQFDPGFNYNMPTTGNWGLYFDGSDYNSGVTLSTDQWYYLVWTRESNTLYFYRDGGLDDSVTVSGTMADGDFYIGVREGLGGDTDGRIDEARFSTTNRSADWTKFSYHSQKITAGTLTFAAQESPASGGRRPTPFRFTSREVTNITSNSSIITWTTTIPTYTELNWSTSPSRVLDQSSSQSYELTTSHSVSLDNLSPDTVYYYVINAQAPSRGNIATGPWSFFTLSVLQKTHKTQENLHKTFSSNNSNNESENSNSNFYSLWYNLFLY